MYSTPRARPASKTKHILQFPETDTAYRLAVGGCSLWNPEPGKFICSGAVTAFSKSSISLTRRRCANWGSFPSPVRKNFSNSFCLNDSIIAAPIPYSIHNVTCLFTFSSPISGLRVKIFRVFSRQVGKRTITDDYGRQERSAKRQTRNRTYRTDKTYEHACLAEPRIAELFRFRFRFFASAKNRKRTAIRLRPAGYAVTRGGRNTEPTNGRFVTAEAARCRPKRVSPLPRLPTTATGRQRQRRIRRLWGECGGGRGCGAPGG